MQHLFRPRRSSTRRRQVGRAPAGAMIALVAVVLLASSGFAVLATRFEHAAGMACETDAAPSTDQADAGLNWGSLPEGATDCVDLAQAAEEAFTNWGQVPKEDSVVTVQIGGS